MLLDTEIYDSWGGHWANLDSSQYFAQLPGWYLCEFCCPLNDSAGGGSVSTGIGAVSDGGSLTFYRGARMLISSTSGQRSQPTAAKLVKMVNTGPIGGSGDYVCGGSWQNSGSGQPLWNGAQRFPQLKCLWVAATSGNTSLAVPVNATWPTPPAYITSAFLNTNVRDTIKFLIRPPICEAEYDAGTATISSQASLNTVGTALPLDTVNVDNYSAFSTATGTWTAPVAGLYYAYGQAAITPTASCTAIAAGLTVTSANYNSGSPVTLWGGSQTPTTAAAPQCAVVRRRVRLNAGDTIQLAGFDHDTGGAGTIQGTGAWTTRLITIWRAA
ncbi:MAG: hypothetical protein ACRDND_03780 [Streptosporangiaceae bacterium]